MSAAERARAERERQGLPERVDDPATLAKVARLLRPRTAYAGQGVAA